MVDRAGQRRRRERIWTKQKAAYTGFAEYEQRTARAIPVIILERAA